MVVGGRGEDITPDGFGCENRLGIGSSLNTDVDLEPQLLLGPLPLHFTSLSLSFYISLSLPLISLARVSSIIWYNSLAKRIFSFH